MVDEHPEGERIVDQYECTRCGERLDDPDATCEDPLCDGTLRRVAPGRE